MEINKKKRNKAVEDGTTGNEKKAYSGIGATLYRPQFGLTGPLTDIF